MRGNWKKHLFQYYTPVTPVQCVVERTSSEQGMVTVEPQTLSNICPWSLGLLFLQRKLCWLNFLESVTDWKS